MRTVEHAAPTRRRRLTAAQRRESILTAATEVFAAAGYGAAKMSDVAARLGVSEPVIFHNFGSKAALFAAVLDRLASDVHAELHTGQHGRAAALLAHILGPPEPWHAHGPRSPRALFAHAVTLTAEPGHPEPSRRTARALAGHLATLIRRGQSEGDLRRDIDPGAAAWLLLSMLATRPLRAATMPHPRRHEPAIAALTLATLLAPGATPHQPASTEKPAPRTHPIRPTNNRRTP
jgi:AcrR family transcriptional regulator